MGIIESEILIKHWREEYEYDAYGNRTLNAEFAWNSGNNIWEIRFKEFLFYSETIGISEKDITKEINIFPNPAKDYAKITAKDGINRIVLYDITGNVVYRSEAKATETRISIGNLSTGIYILRVDTDKGIIQKKLLHK